MKSLETIRSEEAFDWDRNAEFYRADDQSPLMRALAARREQYYGICIGNRVLDVGCGSGAAVASLRARRVDAVGVDYSPAMVEIARNDYALGTHVQCVEATQLPYDSYSFDVVMVNGVLHHLAVQQEISDTLREIHRVLKPGGRLCCFDRNGSVISGIMSVFCIRFKELLRVVARRDPFPSCASRNEVTFGGRRDLRAIRDAGFEMIRRRNVSTLPFFFGVVALNAMQYFLWPGLRRLIERRLARLLTWFDARCGFHCFCVEQFVVFDATSYPVCRSATDTRDKTEERGATASLPALA